MKKVNVVVISGGPSNEREISLKTGAQVLNALPKNKYNLYLIEISKAGRWLLKNATQKQIASGVKSKSLAVSDRNEFRPFDVAFIAMHGKFGEDGKIQALLETIGIPYTGSGILASALGMNKIKTLEIVRRHGIRTPNFLNLSKQPRSKKEFNELDKKISKLFGYPCVVNPNENGSSIGTSIVHRKNELSLALRKALKEDKTILVAEYIKGTELTCAVLGNSGQTELTALPPIEIVPAGEFFDYNSKYFSPNTKEICPARISKSVSSKLQNLAKKAHEIIGCDGLTRSDFILSPGGQLYFLEINTIPGLTEASLSPKAARTAGMNFSEFVDKQIELALLKYGRRTYSS